MIGLDITQAKIFQDLIQDRLTPPEFIEKTHKGPNPPPRIKIISPEECSKQDPESYAHEHCHEVAWNNHGITVQYGKDIYTGQYLTATQNLDDVTRGYSKENLVNLLKDPYYATYKCGIRERIYGDLLIYEILCGNVEDELLSKSEVAIKAWIKNKYTDLID